MHCSRRLIVQTLVFKLSYFHRQVSPSETLLVKGGTTWARNGRWILTENARLPRNIQGSFLHAVNLRHGTDGFTSRPKEGVLIIFFALKKIRLLRPGFEPANVGTKDQHATSRPPKMLKRQFTSTCRCVRPSVRMHQRGSYWTDFCEILCRRNLWISLEKLQIWFKSVRILVTLHKHLRAVFFCDQRHEIAIKAISSNEMASGYSDSRRRTNITPACHNATLHVYYLTCLSLPVYFSGSFLF